MNDTYVKKEILTNPLPKDNDKPDFIIISYIALLHKADKELAPYGVIFYDFPGCIFAGMTVDKALKNAEKGLVFHLEGMHKSGEKIPKPTPLEQILETPDNILCLPVTVQVTFHADIN